MSTRNPTLGRRAGFVVALFFGAALGTMMLRSGLILASGGEWRVCW